MGLLPMSILPHISFSSHQYHSLFCSFCRPPGHSSLAVLTTRCRPSYPISEPVLSLTFISYSSRVSMVSQCRSCFRSTSSLKD